MSGMIFNSSSSSSLNQYYTSDSEAKELLLQMLHQDPRSEDDWLKDNFHEIGGRERSSKPLESSVLRSSSEIDSPQQQHQQHHHRKSGVGSADLRYSPLDLDDLLETAISGSCHCSKLTRVIPSDAPQDWVSDSDVDDQSTNDNDHDEILLCDFEDQLFHECDQNIEDLERTLQEFFFPPSTEISDDGEEQQHSCNLIPIDLVALQDLQIRLEEELVVSRSYAPTGECSRQLLRIRDSRYFRSAITDEQVLHRQAEEWKYRCEWALPYDDLLDGQILINKAFGHRYSVVEDECDEENPDYPVIVGPVFTTGVHDPILFVSNDLREALEEFAETIWSQLATFERRSTLISQGWRDLLDAFENEVLQFRHESNYRTMSNRNFHYELPEHLAHEVFYSRRPIPERWGQGKPKVSTDPEDLDPRLAPRSSTLQGRLTMRLLGHGLSPSSPGGNIPVFAGERLENQEPVDPAQEYALHLELLDRYIQPFEDYFLDFGRYSYLNGQFLGPLVEAAGNVEWRPNLNRVTGPAAECLKTIASLSLQKVQEVEDVHRFSSHAPKHFVDSTDILRVINSFCTLTAVTLGRATCRRWFNSIFDAEKEYFQANRGAVARFAVGIRDTCLAHGCWLIGLSPSAFFRQESMIPLCESMSKLNNDCQIVKNEKEEELVQEGALTHGAPTWWPVFDVQLDSTREQLSASVFAEKCNDEFLSWRLILPSSISSVSRLELFAARPPSWISHSTRESATASALMDGTSFRGNCTYSSPSLQAASPLQVEMGLKPPTAESAVAQKKRTYQSEEEAVKDTARYAPSMFPLFSVLVTPFIRPVELRAVEEAWDDTGSDEFAKNFNFGDLLCSSSLTQGEPIPPVLQARRVECCGVVKARWKRFLRSLPPPILSESLAEKSYRPTGGIVYGDTVRIPRDLPTEHRELIRFCAAESRMSPHPWI